jgi:hypothetical protein
MKYKIVTASSIDLLVEAVQFWIDAGWKPQGSPAFSFMYHQTWIQAIILE